MSTSTIEVSTGPRGCFGCLLAIIGIIGIWAICFGVTIDGKHYGLSCGSSGVVVDTPSKPGVR